MSSDPEFRAVWRRARQYYLPVGFEESLLVRRAAFYQWRAERRLRVEMEQGEECWENPASSFQIESMQEIYASIERKLIGALEPSASEPTAVVGESTAPGSSAGSQPARRRLIPPAGRQYLLREAVADNEQLKWVLARLDMLQRRRRKLRSR